MGTALMRGPRTKIGLLRLRGPNLLLVPLSSVLLGCASGPAIVDSPMLPPADVVAPAESDLAVARDRLGAAQALLQLLLRDRQQQADWLGRHIPSKEISLQPWLPDQGLAPAIKRPQLFSSHHQTLTVLSIWATWCAPCETEAIAFIDAFGGAVPDASAPGKLGAPDVHLVLLALGAQSLPKSISAPASEVSGSKPTTPSVSGPSVPDNSAAALKTFFDKLGGPAKAAQNKRRMDLIRTGQVSVYLDANEQLPAILKLNVQTYPTTVLVDRCGSVRAAFVGDVSARRDSFFATVGRLRNSLHGLRCPGEEARCPTVVPTPQPILPIRRPLAPPASPQPLPTVQPTGTTLGAWQPSPKKKRAKRPFRKSSATHAVSRGPGRS